MSQQGVIQEWNTVHQECRVLYKNKFPFHFKKDYFPLEKSKCILSTYSECFILPMWGKKLSLHSFVFCEKKNKKKVYEVLVK